MYIRKANANIGAVKLSTSFQQPFYPLHTITPLFCHVAYLFSIVDLATMLSNMPLHHVEQPEAFKHYIDIIKFHLLVQVNRCIFSEIYLCIAL